MNETVFGVHAKTRKNRDQPRRDAVDEVEIGRILDLKRAAYRLSLRLGFAFGLPLGPGIRLHEVQSWP